MFSRLPSKHKDAVSTQMHLPAFPNDESERKDRSIQSGKVVTLLVYFTPRVPHSHTERHSPINKALLQNTYVI